MGGSEPAASGVLSLQDARSGPNLWCSPLRSENITAVILDFARDGTLIVDVQIPG